MTLNEQTIRTRVREGQKIVCLHVLGQDLVDCLCEIIHEQDKIIEEFKLRQESLP